MEYYNEDQLYKYFKETIKKEAIKKMDRMRNEIDTIKARELKRIDIEARRQIEWTLGMELQELKKEHQTRINQIAIGVDAKLVEIRNRFFVEIFNSISEKLLAFIKTDAYYQLIFNKVQNLVSKYKESNIIFWIAKNDLKAQAAIEQIADTHYRVEQTEQIKIGGFIAAFDNGIECDETFDAKINNEKEDFIAKSRLFIRN